MAIIRYGSPIDNEVSKEVDKDPEIIKMRSDAFIEIHKFIYDSMREYIRETDEKSEEIEKNEYWSGYRDGAIWAYKYINGFSKDLESDIVEKHNEKFNRLFREREKE